MVLHAKGFRCPRSVGLFPPTKEWIECENILRVKYLEQENVFHFYSISSLFDRCFVNKTIPIGSDPTVMQHLFL